eukprot:32088_1
MFIGDTPNKSLSFIGGMNRQEATPMLEEKPFMSQQSIFIRNNLSHFQKIFEGKALSWRVKYILKQNINRKAESGPTSNSEDGISNGALGEGLSEFYKLSPMNTERLKRASTMGNHVGDVSSVNPGSFFPHKSSKSMSIHTHQSCFMDRYVISSSNLFRPIWDVVVFLLLAYTLLVLPVRVAFGG